mgnify:FL=1
MSQFLVKPFLFVSLLLLVTQLYAGGQREEALSNSVKVVMQKSVSDAPALRLVFANPEEGQAWLAEMSQRLQKQIPDKSDR